MSYGSAPDDERVEERILSYSTSAPTAPITSPSSAPDSTASISGNKHTFVSVPTSEPIHDQINDGDELRSTNPFTITTERALAYSRHTWSNCRPWTEFYSLRALSLPTFEGLSERFSTNLHLYRANYQVLAAIWLIMSLLSSFSSFLFAAIFLVLVARWCSHQASNNGNVLSHRDMVIASFACLIFVWLTGFARQLVTFVVFSCLSIAIHASVHDPSVFETEIGSV